jgi:putative serine protease PepD
MNFETPQPGPLGAEPPVSASDGWPEEAGTVRELPPMPVAPSEPPAPDRSNAGGQGDWKWFVAAALVAAAFTAGAFVAANDADEPEAARNAVPVAVTTPPTTTRAPIDPAPAPTVVPAPIDTTTLLLDASLVGDAVIPSVVTVEITGTMFGDTGRIGSGSGVVFDDQGHIITNDHVVDAGDSYQVVFADGRVYPAELVGTDPRTDLAVLSIGAQNLQPIAVGSSDQLAVGDPAVAVGSPLGLEGTPSLTVGVISAFGREVQTDATTRLYGMLQTDAPITQGSSGGALVDGAGRLVGITTAVGVSEVGIEGIGFATPIEVVTRVVGELIANGEASDPFLGIFGTTVFADTTDGGSVPVGVGIESIEPDTAAAVAGLGAGDVIAAIDGTPVKTMEDLVSQLRRYGAGSSIELTLEDGSALAVTLGERPSA